MVDKCAEGIASRLEMEDLRVQEGVLMCNSSEMYGDACCDC